MLIAGCGAEPTGPAAPGGVTTIGSAGGTAGGSSVSSGPVTSSAGATILEQLSLERINRARLRPAAEAAANSIAVDEGIPGEIDASSKPPLALNAILNQVAKAHSQEMISQDYFAHDTLSGITPYQRMDRAGFAFTTAGENLAWRGTTGTINEPEAVEGEHVDLFVDAGISGRGHRKTMLNAEFREVGIGIVRGQFIDAGVAYDAVMQTQDFATAVDSGTFVLGVVFNDANGNSQYDFGEGVANSSVQLDAVTTTTNAGGGYAFQVRAPGSYVIRFVAANRNYTAAIGSGSPNIKVDLASGNIVINLGLGPL
jgi:uncharacterized protein YkwD